MPQSRPKPSEIAAEAKRIYIPWIARHYERTYPACSVLYPDSLSITVNPTMKTSMWPRVAVMEGDPVDIALGWCQHVQTNGHNVTIPVVNMANEKRPGGDWESGLMAPEECLARRSNLVRALPTPWQSSSKEHYPIPQTGGIYSPSIVIFRDGPDQYEMWRDMRAVPVISVAPVRRPKLDETGSRYSFDQERELMKDKMRTILRIAAQWNHRDICLGAFGVGPIFRNPVREVAEMWKQLLFEESEFTGVFSNVVFAIECSTNGGSRSALSDLEVFQHVFDPSRIFATNYRQRVA